ncbi:MAG: hypothetical protein JO257_12995 [Deltaproteobacteria bacterium]|nr:hypothetical protein [Deltaproteobacteria bacterium]
MSELAFNANGDSFDVPATVTGWRVRRMKPRGAPELVYGRDGRPLTVPVESEIEDLREAAGTPGKYRLDPINDDGKCVEGVPPAYVQVVKPERNASEGAIALASPAPIDDAVREAMRLNTELAKSVIDRFPEMMTAAAELLRAADGAGLPRRAPRDTDDQDEDDDTDAALATASSPGFEFINNLVAQVIPIVITSLAGGKKMNLSSVLDWRKASAEGAQKKASAPALDVTTASESATAHAQTTSAMPPLDPKTMSHFIAIQSALAPSEAALARQVAAELSPAELRAWIDELSALSVPDAVAKVRTMLGGASKDGGAS